MTRRISAALDLACWPILGMVASVIRPWDGGRLLAWVRDTPPEHEPDVVA